MEADLGTSKGKYPQWLEGRKGHPRRRFVFFHRYLQLCSRTWESSWVSKRTCSCEKPLILEKKRFGVEDDHALASPFPPSSSFLGLLVPNQLDPSFKIKQKGF